MTQIRLLLNPFNWRAIGWSCFLPTNPWKDFLTDCREWLKWLWRLGWRDFFVLTVLLSTFIPFFLSSSPLSLIVLFQSWLYPEWPHRQGGCLTCCGCTFESSWVHWFILYSRRSEGTAHEGGGCDQSIGSTVSDAIVRSWLWLTATRGSPLGCFSILQVVDNWPHILW